MRRSRGIERRNTGKRRRKTGKRRRKTGKRRKTRLRNSSYSKGNPKGNHKGNPNKRVGKRKTYRRIMKVGGDPPLQDIITVEFIEEGALGMDLKERLGPHVSIDKVKPGTPASRRPDVVAGLVLTSVAGQSVVGKTLDEVFAIIIGHPERPITFVFGASKLLLFLEKNDKLPYHTKLVAGGWDYDALSWLSLDQFDQWQEYKDALSPVDSHGGWPEDFYDLLSMVRKEETLNKAGITELNRDDFVDICRKDASSKLLILVFARHSSIKAGESFAIPEGVNHFIKGSFDKVTYGFPDEEKVQMKLSDTTRVNREYQQLLNNNTLFNESGCPNSELMKISQGTRYDPGESILNQNFKVYKGGTDEGRRVNDMYVTVDYLFGLLFAPPRRVYDPHPKTYFLSLNRDLEDDEDPDQMKMKTASELYTEWLIPIQAACSKPITFYFDTCRNIDGDVDSGKLSRDLSRQTDKSKACFKEEYNEIFGSKFGEDIRSEIYRRIDEYDNMTDFFYIVELSPERQMLADNILNHNKEAVANIIYKSLFPDRDL
jgi:hypothetical protein